MPKIDVFYDYECPYCLRGYEYLTELLPDFPDVEVVWRPCEAHPRPEEHGPHSDLVIRGMYFARSNGIDLNTYHRAAFAAMHSDRIDVEDAGVLCPYLANILDGDALRRALDTGMYESELAQGNDLAYEHSGVWFLPAFRCGGLKLDALGGTGVTKEQVRSFLTAASDG